MHLSRVNLGSAISLFRVINPRTMQSLKRLSVSSLQLFVFAEERGEVEQISNDSPRCWSRLLNTYRSYVSFVSPSQYSSGSCSTTSISSYSSSVANVQYIRLDTRQQRDYSELFALCIQSKSCLIIYPQAFELFPVGL